MFRIFIILATIIYPIVSMGAQSTDPNLPLKDLLNDGQFDEVISQGRESIRILQSENPSGSLAEAELIDLVVNAAYRGTHVMDDEILDLAKRAVQLKEQYGSGPGDTVTSILHLAALQNGRRDHRVAIGQLEKGLILLEADGADHDLQKAQILSGLAMAHRRLAELKPALDYSLRSLDLQEGLTGPDNPELAATLNTLGLIRMEMGDYSRAKEIFLRILALREPVYGVEDVLVGKALNNLSMVEMYLGEYKDSLESQERAIESLTARLGPDHPSCLWARFNLGVAYLDMGDFQGAVPICEEVLASFQKMFGVDHIETVYALDALGSCLLKAGEPDKALQLYTRSRAIAESELGVGNVDTADTIGQQGRCLAALGRLDEAAEALGNSLGIWREFYDQNSPMLCEPLHAMADIELRRRDPALALDYAEQSEVAVRMALGGSHPLMAQALLLKAQALYAMGQRDGARKLALEAEDISRHHLQVTLRALSESRALDYAAVRTHGLDLALATLDAQTPGPETAAVWDAVVRSRAVVLDEFTARNRMMGRLEGTPAADLADSSLVLRERLGNLSLRGPGWEGVQDYRKLLDETNAEILELERRLSLLNSSWETAGDSLGIGWPEVKESIPANTALVAFVRHAAFDAEGIQDDASAEYKAFVLPDAGAEPVLIDLGDASTIDDLVGQWQDQVEFGDHGNLSPRGLVLVSRDQDRSLESYLAVGERLRQVIWDPVAGLLVENCRVFVVPAGTINLVNLAALPVGGNFLVEQERRIHILDSERNIAAAPSAATGTGLLVFSDPDFGSESLEVAEGPSSAEPVERGAKPCLSLADLGFEALPMTRIEARDIVSIWSAGRDSSCAQVQLFRGREATEAAFKSRAPGYGFLHLATHGFFLPTLCTTGKSGQTRDWDSLVSSGLVFAGGNSWQNAPPGSEDGILTAQEVAALDLNGVRWVVLSACSTGLGSLSAQGEGVFGLRRAFTLAGARTLVMSLWSVDDDSAREWMVELYKANITDELGAADACWAATRSVLAARRDEGRSLHPHHWGAFVAAGDWRRVE